MMVGFYHAGESPVYVQLAARLIASVRRAMPGVRLTHLTDPSSTAIAGTDAVVRLAEGPVALACLDAYAACLGDWLFVDTDVVVQRDVRAVFDFQFDVAVADRAGTLLPKEVGTKFMARNPYNKGAVFSRSPAFWRDAAADLRTRSATRQAWMGDQEAMNAVIAAGRYQVRVLPSAYNYPPQAQHEDVADKAILHFKGPHRKVWALASAA